MSYTSVDDPFMFPGTCYPTDEGALTDWNEFVESVDYVPGLNQVLSWVVHCRECYESRGDDFMMDEGDKDRFEIHFHCPRKSTNWKISFEFSEGFDHALVDNWIDSYLKPRICQWYGFEDSIEPQVWQAFINR